MWRFLMALADDLYRDPANVDVVASNLSSHAVPSRSRISHFTRLSLPPSSEWIALRTSRSLSLFPRQSAFLTRRTARSRASALSPP